MCSVRRWKCSLLIQLITSTLLYLYYLYLYEINFNIFISPFRYRYEVPGVHGFNFVLKNSLGGGGIGALNPDPQGKGYAQMLADFKIENVPELL